MADYNLSATGIKSQAKASSIIPITFKRIRSISFVHKQSNYHSDLELIFAIPVNFYSLGLDDLFTFVDSFFPEIFTPIPPLNP